MSQTIPLILEEDVEQGGKEYDEDIENDFAYRNNVAQATKSIRMAFIRKVYGLLTMQIFLTIVIASICMFTPPIKDFVHSNYSEKIPEGQSGIHYIFVGNDTKRINLTHFTGEGITLNQCKLQQSSGLVYKPIIYTFLSDWILMPTFLGSIALLLALHIKRRESPTNLILLAAFTIVQAYTIGVIVTFYSQAVVLQALLLTFVVLAGLTLYTFQTKRDFSAIHSALFAGLCILIIGGFMQVFLQSTVFEIAIGFGGALVFSLFIIFDTQLIMKTLSPEEYILATINLYMDIVNLFLYILRILQAVNRQ